MFKDKDKLELVSSWKVSCSGDCGDVSLGHPLVWLQIPEELGFVICPYCEKKFLYKETIDRGRKANGN
ncbi:MAG: zinc-finger domain-containing protein [Paracoccaceae bacterium]